MRLLLDTHTALWAVDAPELLSDAARQAMAEADELAVSVVSIWEIAIKHAVRAHRKDRIRFSGAEARRLFEQAGFALLPVTPDHAAAVDDLPPLHGDPFDRMLIAQARTEPMHFLTADRRLEAYGTPVMVA